MFLPIESLNSFSLHLGFAVSRAACILINRKNIDALSIERRSVPVAVALRSFEKATTFVPRHVRRPDTFTFPARS